MATGGAWVCQHLWEHYLYTGDKKFLADVYPAMKGAADYFLSSMVKHPKYDWMVVCPSVSPEQGGVVAGCTMDNQLIIELLTKRLKPMKYWVKVRLPSKIVRVIGEIASHAHW